MNASYHEPQANNHGTNIGCRLRRHDTEARSHYKGPLCRFLLIFPSFLVANDKVAKDRLE
jgi:hypothetical protein